MNSFEGLEQLNPNLANRLQRERFAPLEQIVLEGVSELLDNHERKGSGDTGCESSSPIDLGEADLCRILVQLCQNHMLLVVHFRVLCDLDQNFLLEQHICPLVQHSIGTLVRKYSLKFEALL